MLHLPIDETAHEHNASTPSEVFDSSLELMKCLKYTTDIMQECKLYEREEKFKTDKTSTVKKHPFSHILTGLAKILSIFTFGADATPYAHFDQLLQRNSWEYLETLTFFAKPLDDQSGKLRDFILQILRNLFFSGKCELMKERLEKVRFTDVISYGVISSQGTFEMSKDYKDKYKTSKTKKAPAKRSGTHGKKK